LFQFLNHSTKSCSSLNGSKERNKKIFHFSLKEAGDVCWSFLPYCKYPNGIADYAGNKWTDFNMYILKRIKKKAEVKRY
jgi:hypothetical protein